MMKKHIIFCIAMAWFANAHTQQMIISAGTSVVVKRGTVTANMLNISGELTNNGTLVDAGAIHISQDYTNANILNVQIAGTTLGTHYDPIYVAGTASLSGTLNVTFTNGFTGSLGDEFIIIDAASISGVFSNVNLPSLSAGLVWSTTYNFVAGIMKISIVSTVLPVELLDFSAKAIENKDTDPYSKLVWRTAIENNMANFTVEKSRDGQYFEAIGTVPAKGSNSEYLFLDKKPYQDNNYYRLKINDLDKSFEYSNIIVVNFAKAKKDIRIYPTIVTDFLTIEHDAATQIEQIQVIDAAGKLVKLFEKASNQIELNELSAGMYFIQIKSVDNRIFVEKIVKE